MALKKDPKSGKWHASIGSSKQGTRKKKTFCSRKDAETWLSYQENAKVEQQIRGTISFMPVHEALERFIVSKKDRSVKYLDHLRRDITAIIDECKLRVISDITAEVLNNYLAEEHEGVTVYNTRKRIKHVKALCYFIELQGWYRFDRLGTVKTTRPKSKGRRALSLEECILLLHHLKKTSLTWHDIIFTMIQTGLRKSEIIFLEWSDLDFHSGFLKVQPKPHIIIRGDPVLCKTQESRRAIPMSQKLQDVLKAMPKRSSFVFSTEEGNHRENNFLRDFKFACANAPLSNIKTVTPHVLRHTFISHLLIYGKQDLLTVSKLAGHTSVETTQIYLHLLGGDNQKKEAIDSLPDYEI